MKNFFTKIFNKFRKNKFRKIFYSKHHYLWAIRLEFAYFKLIQNLIPTRNYPFYNISFL